MIESLKHWFRGIFVKFTLMFILVGLIPVMGMSYLVFEKLPDEIESSMVLSYDESLRYASKNISMKIYEYDQLMKNIYNYGRSENKMIGDILRNEDYSDLSSYADSYLEDYFRSLLYSESNISSGFLLGSDQEVFDYYSKSTSYYYENIDLKALPTFESIYETKKDLTIMPTHRERYFEESNKEVVTFARHYLDLNYLPESEHIVATLLLDVEISFIEEIISRMELKEKGNIFILDGKGYSIYESEAKTREISASFDRLRQAIGTSTSGYRVSGGQYQFYQRIEGSDWLMIFNVDQSRVQKLIEDFSTITVLIMGVVIIALIVVAFTFSGNLSKPIRSIIDQMKVVSSGHLDTKVSIKASYEVNQLADAFNDMTEQLILHIDKAYGAQLKQREAELNGLKTQIRPHYLYNTLEIIRMSALEESADTTREMIVSLSEQLKYMIGQYGDLVTLGDELAMIENYFMIIEKRYDGRITLALDIPNRLYSHMMLKLLLQPLVENAVVHGLKVKKGKGKVRVGGSIENGVLTLHVMDDGVGMSDKVIEDIQALLDGEQMGKAYDGNWNNVGLKNVHDRIQMYYGTGYGLTISSKEKIGTKMSIRIPIEQE